MKSIPLAISARFLAPVFMLLSLLVLYRGHHLPGGGFIGGLLAASAVALILLTDGVEKAQRFLRIDPATLVMAGLATAMASGLVAVLSGEVFMKGKWLPAFDLPLLGSIHLGTPLLFDVGVYLTVTGFVTQCLFSLSGKSDEEEAG